MEYSNRSVLLYVGTEIERIGEELDATEETQCDAIRLCGDVLRSGYDYDSVDSVAGACFYLACTRQDEPISLPEIADESRKSKKNVQHLGGNLMKELDIQPSPVEPDTYIEDAVEHFDLTDEQRTECFDLLKRAKDRKLHSGLAPTTVAGAILYAVARKHRIDLKQKEVAEFVGKTTVSIRNNFRDMLRLADDVPVDVLPPRTTEDSIGRLKAEFDEQPAIYAEEARELVQGAELGPEPSRAGVAGGAYLTVASRAGSNVTAEEISSVVGVSPQTVQKYSARFKNAY